MDFTELKHVTFSELSDNKLNFNWSEKYYHPIVINFQKPNISVIYNNNIIYFLVYIWQILATQ